MGADTDTAVKSTGAARRTGIAAERQRERGGPREEEGEVESESETTGQAVLGWGGGVFILKLIQGVVFF